MEMVLASATVPKESAEGKRLAEGRDQALADTRIGQPVRALRKRNEIKLDSRAMKVVGEPSTGNLYTRFDEGRGGQARKGLSPRLLYSKRACPALQTDQLFPRFP